MDSPNSFFDNTDQWLTPDVNTPRAYLPAFPVPGEERLVKVNRNEQVLTNAQAAELGASKKSLHPIKDRAVQDRLNQLINAPPKSEL